MRCLRCGTENPDNANHCHKCNATLRRLCPRCRAVNTQKQLFCGSCGLKLINICPRCKAQNTPVQRYCGNCGYKIINFCPHCGMNNPVGQRYCGNCATRLIPDQGQRPEKGDRRAEPPYQRPLPPRQPQSQSLPPRQPQQMMPPQDRPRERMPQNLPPRGAMPAAPVERELPSQPQRPPQPPPPQQRSAPVAQPQQPQVTQPVQQQTSEQTATTQFTQPIIEQTVQQEVKPDIIAKVDTTPPSPEFATREVEISPDIVTDNITEITTVADNIAIDEPQTIEEKLISSLADPDIIDNEEETGFAVIDEQVESVQPAAPTEEFEFGEPIPQDLTAPPELEVEYQEMTEEPLEVQPPAEVEEIDTDELQRFAVLSVEIINLPNLLDLLDKQTVDSISNKVMSLIANISDQKKEHFIAVAENLGFVSFRHSSDKQGSSISAVETAREVIKLSKILNQQLMAAYKIDVKLKIGVAFNDSPKTSDIERTMAKEGNIVVNEEVKRDTENIYKYSIIGPLPIGNQMVTFYKYASPIDQPEEEFELKEKPAQQPKPAQTKVEHDQAPVSTTQTISLHEKEQLPQFDNKYLNFDAVVNTLVNASILTENSGKGQFISIISEDGYGKSTAIRTIKSSLSPQSFLWFITRCGFYEKEIPLSAIRNLLRNFFGISNITYDREESKKIVRDGITSAIGANDQLIYIVTSLILDEPAGGITKEHLVYAIIELIRSIQANSTPIIIIEDLDSIDSSSLEIIEALIQNKLLDLKVLIITTFHSTFNLVDLKPNMVKDIKYTQLNIKPTEPQDLDKIIQGILQAPLVLPDSVKQQMITATQSVPLAIEYLLALMVAFEIIKMTPSGPVFNEGATHWQPPQNLQDILTQLLTRLSQNNPNAFYLLQIGSVLGPKFTKRLLQDVAQIGKGLDETIQFLFSTGFLLMEDLDNLMFKHNIIWEIMYYYGVPYDDKPHMHMNVLNYLEDLIQSGGYVDLSYIAYQAELAGKKRKALNYWNVVANQTIALGMASGYSEIMKRYIEILDASDIPEKESLKTAAMLGLARVAYNSNPELAVQTINTLLPLLEQQNDLAKLVEYRGYLSYSLMQEGKWEEAIENINKSLALINPETSPLDYAMLITTQLEPMDNMGKIGWIYNTCRTKIFPVFEAVLKDKNFPPHVNDEQLFRLYCNSKIYFANALTNVGHVESVRAYEELRAEVERRGLQDIILKFFLLRIKANTIIGDVKNAEIQLAQSREYLSQMQNVENLISVWCEAACYLFLEIGKWDSLVQVMEVTNEHAHRNNNYGLIALIKGCEGAMKLASNDINSAKAILNDLLNYSSQYKLVLYTLMAWYYLAKASIRENDYDNAESIIHRALDMAAIPDIMNLNYTISFKRLLGEVYMDQGNMDEAKKVLNEAEEAAGSLQNLNHMAKNSILMARLHQELIPNFEENKVELAQKASEYINNAINIFTQLGNEYQLKLAEKAKENLDFVCKVNSIKLP